MNRFKEITLSELEKRSCLFKDGAWVQLKEQNPRGKVRIIHLADVKEFSFKQKSCRFLNAKKAQKLKCIFIKPNDILIARLPSPLGRACLFPFKKGKYVAINDITIFRNVLKNLDAQYLCYCLNSPVIRAKMRALHSGSMRDRITKQKLGDIPLPIAPIQVQKSIASKLNVLFLAIDHVNEEVQKIIKNIELYTASVFKAAMLGKLVPQDPEDEPACDLLEKIKHHPERLMDEKLKKTKLFYSTTISEVPFVLPKGWVWAPLGALVFWVLYKGLNNSLGDLKNTQVVNINTVRAGELDFTPVEYLSSINPKVIKPVEPGDLLFYSETNSSLIRRCGIFKGNSLTATFSHNLIRLKCPREVIEPHFMAAAINFMYSYGWIQKCGYSAATLNTSKLLSLPIPLAPFKEQIRIVKAMQKSLCNIQAILNDLSIQQKTLVLLKQSILGQIFKG